MEGMNHVGLFTQCVICFPRVVFTELQGFLKFHSNASFSDIELPCINSLGEISAAGWIGFLWTVWLAAKKSVDLTKHSLSMTGSALSAYSASRHTRHRGREKVVD